MYVKCSKSSIFKDRRKQKWRLTMYSNGPKSTPCFQTFERKYFLNNGFTVLQGTDCEQFELILCDDCKQKLLKVELFEKYKMCYKIDYQRSCQQPPGMLTFMALFAAIFYYRKNYLLKNIFTLFLLLLYNVVVIVEFSTFIKTSQRLYHKLNTILRLQILSNHILLCSDQYYEHSNFFQTLCPPFK